MEGCRGIPFLRTRSKTVLRRQVFKTRQIVNRERGKILFKSNERSEDSYIGLSDSCFFFQVKSSNALMCIHTY